MGMGVPENVCTSHLKQRHSLSGAGPGWKRRIWVRTGGVAESLICKRGKASLSAASLLCGLQGWARTEEGVRGFYKRERGQAAGGVPFRVQEEWNDQKVLCGRVLS
ncbi:hypothetical protein ACLOJK_001232 [Asimina triloba]